MIHTDQHDAEVCSALGIMKPRPDARLVGIEIETGWQSEAKRAAFFKGIDRAGIGEMAISKHDGTIGVRGRTLAAELVSRPMSFGDIRAFVDKAGKVIEAQTDKGLITSGCGVHIHVSESMFETDPLWRFAASICHDKASIDRWLKDAKDEVRNTAARQSRLVHAFWDDLSLRGPNKNSARLPYRTVREIPVTTSHDRAFIHGRATPTYETRIFRTPKSRRVMMSYVDAVESLLDFSTNADDAFIERGPNIDMDKVRWIEKNTAPRMGQTRDIVYDLRTGDQYPMKDAKYYIINDTYYFYLKNGPLRPPTEEEAMFVSMAVNGKGARGWVDGALPLKAYIKYVLDRVDKYPHLAQRLRYDKFAAYLNGEAQDAAMTKHRDKPHLEFCLGCLVRIEHNGANLWEIVGMRPAQGNRYGMASVELSLVKGADDGVSHEQPINVLTHACKGALEAGGEL